MNPKLGLIIGWQTYADLAQVTTSNIKDKRITIRSSNVDYKAMAKNSKLFQPERMSKKAKAKAKKNK